VWLRYGLCRCGYGLVYVSLGYGLCWLYVLGMGCVGMGCVCVAKVFDVYVWLRYGLCMCG
jgi:hypothetical protein